MYLDVFIESFSLLAERLVYMIDDRESNKVLQRVVEKTFKCNNLFTPQMQYESLRAIAEQYLDKHALKEWTFKYKDFIIESEQEVLVVMAGNLPLVGFHDLLTVLASGKRAVVKMSSSDNVLLPFIAQILVDIDTYWQNRIKFVEKLPVDPAVVIATGSDSTAHFFENLYPKARKLVRGSKSSIAVLKGSESEMDISLLSRDMFLYFGMGCRSVSSLLVPEGTDIGSLAQRLGTGSKILSGSQSYSNSYRYQKALSLMNGECVVDGGLFLIKINSAFPPPMSVVSVVEYKGKEGIDDFLLKNQDKIQCVVNHEYKDGFISFGNSQLPALEEYADGVNSLAFLLKIINFA
ncbi:MAG: acyl-CoA reductase [Bacteroidales bacterium]|jgi:hypothetical protein|nr:acyl-CoA reductase [Bacteroidales bacterium]MDD3299597.1 acyl-CoA reductase [Bacteroidales bacterium]MDD3844269.1 acyl-CoA reductase [Bacteroidales bacterium]MDD4618809.1 acyl-CoA reductase [Bacteroidales bacterium]